MPLVAVVIPVRDRATMLTDAIASVAMQTMRDHALIVVDDGSRDESAAVAAAALATAALPGRCLV
jgi:glycosyltransferase involved in cell wall biosynthesis